jgi:drug/metabolite transporter (DMT)-like permease
VPFNFTPPARAYATLAFVMLFWATNSIVGRAVRDDVPPLTLALFRWIGALAIVLPLAWRHLGRDRIELVQNWRIVLVLGLLGIAGFNAFLYSGLGHTTASNALLLQAGTPAMVLAVNRLFFGARSPRIEVAAVMLATLGVVWIVFRGDPQMLFNFRLNPGDALILTAVTIWAFYTSLLRFRPAVHAFSFLTVTFAIGVVAMTPLAIGEWAQGKQVVAGWHVVAATTYVAIFPSVIAYTLYNNAVSAIGASNAGRTIALMPLFGALLAAFLLGERLYGYHLAGMVLILAGVLLPVVAPTHRFAAANRARGH